MNAIFFPRNDYPNNVEICPHRLGKKMTYTESTDTLRLSVSYDFILSEAKSRNIKVSAFANYADFNDANIGKALTDLNNDDLWLDMYSYCPTISDKLEHGGTVTAEEWLTAYNTYILPNFLQATGKKPIALSASYGNTTFSDYVTQFLAFKNSVPQSAGTYAEYPTNYGIGNGNPNNIPYNFANYHPIRNTTRWFDNAISQGAEQDSSVFTRVLSEVADEIDATMINGGWFNNFTHWHWVYNPGTYDYRSIYEGYFDMLAQKNADNEIYFAGYGEAVAYMVYREMISRAVMYSPVGYENSRLVIRLEAKNVFNIDTDLLQIPISIKFSTTGTPLEGQTIRCEQNLISLGNNQYIVEIPWSEYPGTVIEKVNI